MYEARSRTEMEGWAMVAEHMLTQAAQRIVVTVEEPSARAALTSSFSDGLLELSSQFVSSTAALLNKQIHSAHARREESAAAAEADAHYQQQQRKFALDDIAAEMQMKQAQLREWDTQIGEREEQWQTLSEGYTRLAEAYGALENDTQVLREEADVLTVGREALQDVQDRLEEIYARVQAMVQPPDGDDSRNNNSAREELDVDALLDTIEDNLRMVWEENCQLRALMISQQQQHAPPAAAAAVKKADRRASATSPAPARPTSKHTNNGHAAVEPAANRTGSPNCDYELHREDEDDGIDDDDDDVLLVSTPQPKYTRIVPPQNVNAVTATLIKVQAQVRALRDPSIGRVTAAINGNRPRQGSKGSTAHIIIDESVVSGSRMHDSSVVCTPRPTQEVIHGYIHRSLYRQYRGTPRREASPEMTSTSPAASGAWRERMHELQGELRGLRRELGGTSGSAYTPRAASAVSHEAAE